MRLFSRHNDLGVNCLNNHQVGFTSCHVLLKLKTLKQKIKVDRVPNSQGREDPTLPIVAKIPLKNLQILAGMSPVRLNNQKLFPIWVFQ